MRAIILALTLALPLGCAVKSAPVLVADTGIKLAESVRTLQEATTTLQKSGLISVQQALRAQNELLQANTELAKLPALLKAIDTATTPQGDVITSIDRAVLILQQAGPLLTGVGVGWPDSDAVAKVIQLARVSQQLVITTAAELGRAREAVR